MGHFGFSFFPKYRIRVLLFHYFFSNGFVIFSGLAQTPALPALADKVRQESQILFVHVPLLVTQ